MQDPIQKYLARYAEPDCKVSLQRNYETCLLVPAHRESAESIHQVSSRLKESDGLLLIIVNNSSTPDDPAARQLHDALTSDRDTTKLSDHAVLVRSEPDLLLVDRFSRGREVPRRQGVGLARKLGCDMALYLQHRGDITRQWIYTTDADAVLPSNYFAQDIPSSAVARIAGFEHIPDPGLETACLLYDIRLLYHAAGLSWAGSPHGYPAIGSLISFSPVAYAQVRGFPRRNTGEDFYLLNKLRKLGPIETDADTTVTLAGRLSDRVPIGTGPALAAISELSHPETDYRFEHPDCYTDLRGFLEGIEQLATTQPPDFSWQNESLHAFSLARGFYDHYDRKRHSQPAASVMRKHLHDWFDGLKTRQLIHYLRDERYGSVTAAELGHAPFIEAAADVSSIRDVLYRRVYRLTPAR